METTNRVDIVNVGCADMNPSCRQGFVNATCTGAATIQNAVSTGQSNTPFFNCLSLRLQSGGSRWLAMLILVGKNPEPIADRQTGPKPAIRRHALI